MQMVDLRQGLTRDQRSIDLYHFIDPGFINPRKCVSAFGQLLVDEFRRIASDREDRFSGIHEDYLVVSLVLEFCKKLGVPTLGQYLAAPIDGGLICSTERLKGTKSVYRARRFRNQVIFPYRKKPQVFVEASSRHLVSDTGRMMQSKESTVAIVGEARQESEKVVIHPLIMGIPTLDHRLNYGPDEQFNHKLIWYAWSWFETFPEDIDEFQRLGKIAKPPLDKWQKYMKAASEHQIKAKICELLDEEPKSDWGGEQDDHFTAHIHLAGKRSTAAFVFKGPGRFREMTPEMLGKRADQIYRLSTTPASLLVVQHCHLIGEAVRATLRAFAVSPSAPRRYCLIDGPDTYRLLKAYGKL